MLERFTKTLRVWLSSLRTAPGRQNIAYELKRRLGGEPPLPGPVRRVVFLCHGNICRSPFAAELFAARYAAVEVRSAGLAASGGDPAQPGALRVARELGVDLDAHRSTRMGSELAEWADLIVGMEGHHVREVERRWPQATGKALILGDFLEDPPHWIEDPWGRPDDAFRVVFARIVRAADELGHRIEKQEPAC